MKALLASAEATPFAKVGGLADVVGSLPGALRNLGVDARVIIPGYGFIDRSAYDIRPVCVFALPHRLDISIVTLSACEHAGAPFYLLESPPFFGGESAVYGEWEWDMTRFILYSQALMAALHQLAARLDWRPDVVHVNDWHTALLPFMLRAHGDGQSAPATALGIHNIAYQGQGAGGFLWNAGIHGRDHADLHELGLSDNLLGIGIAYSDMIATVSPRYAEEIKYPYAGYELAPLIERRAHDMRGILNGLDTDSFDPCHRSPRWKPISTAATSRGRRPLNKRHLQSLAGLPVDESSVPLVGVVSRLAAQKGF